jgi:hypothetical protein
VLVHDERHAIQHRRVSLLGGRKETKIRNPTIASTACDRVPVHPKILPAPSAAESQSTRCGEVSQPTLSTGNMRCHNGFSP